MTVVAYRMDEQVLVADSCVSGDGIDWGACRKIVRGKNGTLAGAAGSVTCLTSFLDWVERGMSARRKPRMADDENFEAIVISPDGSVRIYDSNLMHYVLGAPYYAIGLGAQVAVGALAADASAERAVAIAIRHAAHCKPPIVGLRLDGKPWKSQVDGTKSGR